MATAIEMLQLREIERCPECKCAIGDDWQFKGFSNKTIVICPQCGHEINVNDEEDEEPEEHFFDIRIVGSSTTHDEQELIDALYNFLKDKAEFQIK